MCGFYGLISENLDDEADLLSLNKLISSKLSSRGPDNFSSVLIEDKIYLSHSRLAIHDCRSISNQPFSIRRKYLIFNGEIYNFRYLRQVLESENEIKFSTDSDTEVLIQLLINYGIDSTLNKIEGMFAFAYIDLDASKVFLASDRYAQKPFYYKYDNNGFEFGSFFLDILNRQNSKLDISSINEYFRTGSYPLNKTIYCGVERVPQSSYITFDYSTNLLSQTRYSELINSKKNYKKDCDWGKLFEDTVLEYVDSDVPVAALVSGGIDSTCLMIALSKIQTKIECITADTCDELSEGESAKTIAKYLNLNHSLVNLSDLSSETMEVIIKNMPQPLADPAVLPLSLIAKKMNEEGIKVGILGDGGDELFNGYQKHYENSLNSAKSIFNHFNFIKRFDSYLPDDLSRKIRYLTFGQNFHKYSSVYFYHCLRNMGLIKKPSYLINDVYNWESLIKSNPLYADSLILQKNEYHYRIPNRFTPKVDISGMSFSVEYRVPFLDTRLVDFTFSSNQNKRSTQLEYIKKVIPDELISNEKKGLGLNLSNLLAGSLYPWSLSIFKKIDNGSFRDLECIFDFSKLNIMWNKNKKTNSYSRELYFIFVFLTWWENRF